MVGVYFIYFPLVTSVSFRLVQDTDTDMALIPPYLCLVRERTCAALEGRLVSIISGRLDGRGKGLDVRG